MTPEQAIADLEAKRDALVAAMAEARRVVGLEAVRRIQADWPVGEARRGQKHSRDTWRYDEQRGVVNDSPHVEYVHDGLASRLVPQVLEDLEPLYQETLTRFLDEVH